MMSEKIEPLSFRESLGELYRAKSTDVPWLRELRKTAFERFQTLGFPERKWEAWKYLNLEPLLAAPFEPKASSAVSLESLPAEILSYGEPEEPRLVFINGIFASNLSLPIKERGIYFGSLKEALRSQSSQLSLQIGKKTKEEVSPFAALNTFLFEDGAYLFVPQGLELKRPLHLIFIQKEHLGSPLALHPRILVTLEKGAKANLIYHETGDNTPDFSNLVWETKVGEGASLDLISIQMPKEQMRQFLSSRVSLCRESRFSLVQFVGSRGLLRNDFQIAFEGENAICHLSGLSVLTHKAQVFHHAVVHHAVPQSTSRQVYKNILSGEAVAEFNSLVHVSPGAFRSDSNQLNRNLLLSEKARAYSRPQLKIYSDDVAATHGSATGKLEERELFYLQSRGLDLKTARLLLIQGFVEDILNRMTHVRIRERLLGRVAGELQEILGEKG